MIWKPQSILTLSTDTGEWTKTRFETGAQYRDFVTSMEKFPGEYNFKNTEYWKQPAIKFEKDGRYCDYEPSSQDYKNFFLEERRKCIQGIIVDGVYVSADYYFFINYTRIYEKISAQFIMPEIWDGHYHYDLHLLLAWLNGQDSAMTKARQKGISLYHMARLARRLWFSKGAVLKVIGNEETYVNDEWAILETYRNHLNEHTGWYRAFSPDESLNWTQRKSVVQGTFEKKEIKKGNLTKIRGFTTKNNVTKAVGGPALEVYVTEAGVNPKLKKVKGFIDPNMKQGGVKTGFYCAAGAVGELKDAEDLQDYCFNPIKYGIRAVEDRFSENTDPIAFFFPEEWNYVHADENRNVIKCYDKDGNSDIQLAIKFILEEEEKMRKMGGEDYRLWKSQHPRNLQEAFDTREDNIFPTAILKEQELKLHSYSPIIIKLEKDPYNTDKLKHQFCNDIPVRKLKPDPKEDNRGAIIIQEFPIENPPFGLYYAGVDPIYNKDTETSRSLMAIRIWIGMHERDGKIVEPYPVAHYIGRHKNVRDTYQVCADLIEWYNARAAVESNVKDFIEWMIQNGRSRYLMRRRELTVINELTPDSTIKDEIGVFMEGKFKERCLEKYINWLQLPIAKEFDLTTGESNNVYNASKITDKLLLKEMLTYTSKKNTDRLIADMLALVATQSTANRHVVVTVKSPLRKREEKPKILTPSQVSTFKNRTRVMNKRIPSAFSKR